jgi:hypothetical protein
LPFLFFLVSNLYFDIQKIDYLSITFFDFVNFDKFIIEIQNCYILNENNFININELLQKYELSDYIEINKKFINYIINQFNENFYVELDKIKNNLFYDYLKLSKKCFINNLDTILENLIIYIIKKIKYEILTNSLFFMNLLENKIT